MDFQASARQREWYERVASFMDTKIYPSIPAYEEEMAVTGEDRWKVITVVEELKALAKSEGLWNLFMPPHPSDAQGSENFVFDAPGLTNLEYAPIAELTGRVLWSPEVFNCSAPDTGNMEILLRYGTPEQKERWLRPLMNGEIRSAFLMTEPQVASSDATNIETSISRSGDEFVINGRKWWSSGVGSPRCEFAIVMGKTNPNAPIHLQQSQIIVPMDTPGVHIERMIDLFGYDEAPYGHAEVELRDVRVPASNVLYGEGRGFEIAQGRLGPGRIHHCMRTIGAAEAALELMVKRLVSREVFGKRISEYSVWEERIAKARTNIEMTRLLCLKAADVIDRAGNKAARHDIAMIKYAAPTMALKVIDDAIQAFGGAGVTDDFGLGLSYAFHRALRIADGPDEVHARTIARSEVKKHAEDL